MMIYFLLKPIFDFRWHLGYCNETYLPTNRGFETFRGFLEGSQDYYTHLRGASGNIQRFELFQNLIV